MTKQHFEEIAAVFRRHIKTSHHCGESIAVLAMLNLREDLARTLKQYDPNFDFHKFCKACDGREE